MNGLLNVMRREGANANSHKALPRRGIVTAYDPAHYAAKVLIQPENIETGFLPIGSPFVGSGWGMYGPPSPGDEVEVHFQEGGKNAAYIGLRFYGNVTQPLSVPSGEFWLVHKSGSFVKLHNDGTIEINAAGNISVTAPNLNLTGNLNVTGNILATEDISDQSGVAGTIAHIRTIYDEHTHPAPGGTTGTPNQTL